MCSPCPSGYSGTGDTICTDIDECAAGTATCDPLVTCSNTAGSYTCGDCPTGYTGGGATGCMDINECLTANGGCDRSPPAPTRPARAPAALVQAATRARERRCASTSTNASPTTAAATRSRPAPTHPARHTCGGCPAGYTGGGATGCTDINECLTGNGGCDALTTCTNTPGLPHLWRLSDRLHGHRRHLLRRHQRMPHRQRRLRRAHHLHQHPGLPHLRGLSGGLHGHRRHLLRRHQ